MPSTGPNPTDLLYDDTFNSTVYAGFGQLAYDVAEGVEIALALRYDSEQSDVDNNEPTGANSRAQTPLFAFGTNPYINPAYTANPAYATGGIPDRRETFDQLQPKLSVNWKLADDFSLFASYGYGFRSGGFNSSGSAGTVDQAFSALELDDGTPNIREVSDTYREEVSKAGLRMRVLNIGCATRHAD